MEFLRSEWWFLCVSSPEICTPEFLFFLDGEKHVFFCTKGAIEYEQRIWISDDAGNLLPIGIFDAWSNGLKGWMGEGLT